MRDRSSSGTERCDFHEEREAKYHYDGEYHCEACHAAIVGHEPDPSKMDTGGGR